MAVYTGYFDESGDEVVDPRLIIGGWLFDVDHIKSFDTLWLDAIKDLPLDKYGNPYLHTAGFVGGYHKDYALNWSGKLPEKRDILIECAKVIDRFAIQLFSIELDTENYAKTDKLLMFSESVGHPYAIACAYARLHLDAWAKANNVLSPVKMVIERRLQKSDDIVACFQNNGLDEPAKEDGKSIPALQAADYIAWMTAKQIEPTYAYEQVKESWKFVNNDRLIAAKISIEDFRKLVDNVPDFYPGTTIPDRDGNHTVEFLSLPGVRRRRANRKS